MKIHDVMDNVYCIDTMVNGEKEVVASFILDFEKVAIVETGPRCVAKSILDALNEIGIKREKVRYIALTHIHLDHGGGAGTLIKELPNAVILVHPRGVKHIIDPAKLWTASQSVLGDLAEIYQPPEPVPASRVFGVDDMQKISLGNDDLVAIHTPGHASHHIVFHLRNLNMLFTGDHAGIYRNGWIAPTTPPPFYFEETLKSFEKLKSLKPRNLGFTHFGFADNELERAEKKIIEWAKIAEDVIRNGGGVEDLHAKLYEIDKDFVNILKYYKHSKIIQEAFRVGLAGLIEAVRPKVI